MRWSTMLLLAGVVLVSYLVFGPRQTRPALRRQLSAPVLDMLLATLHRQGFDRGMLFVYVEGDPRFVQFMKTLDANGRARVRADYPLVGWSAPYFEKVRELLRRDGIAFQEDSGAGSVPMQGAPPSRVLVVDFGSDLIAARQFATNVFSEVYGVDVAKHGVAWLENFSNLPRRIGVD